MLLLGFSDDILTVILSYIDGSDLSRLAMTSRTATAVVKQLSFLWEKLIYKHELGRQAHEVLGKQLKFPLEKIFARLYCYDNKLCCYCFQTCKRPELPTKRPEENPRPICLWAKRKRVLVECT
mmetsp:Transcript_14583/g.23743  ORF Transcript_14583/g.23743 Transcript_14583/m.23743 type:complete len:123 (-) Transcript_14583:887-1255(-)